MDRHQVCLGVEHPPVQVDLVSVREEQVEVLEGLSQEERLHHVPGPRVQRVTHVADGGVAAGHLGVRLYALGWEGVRRTDRMKPVLPGRFASPSPGRFCCLVEEMQWHGTTIDLVLALYTRWCGTCMGLIQYRYWYTTAYNASTVQEYVKVKYSFKLSGAG